ncbi:MAG: hypothetical protein HOC77_04715 [Chloroflexi bacterium]|jgi:hypothetical protein|nr:hypothetical protein [Chloroflexota bacterium]MBT4073066.1 hypothetical protein [Chloroflexota bacterium]MBT4514380.1 hypothetical protein [Chloroflexota bacterium]MBT6681729.1 hypothetical protein [Chloroflexota bacterium]
MTLAPRRLPIRLQRGPTMLLSSVLLALVLSIYFGAWAVSANVDARSLRSINDSGLTPDARAAALADGEQTGVEHTFLFLCPFH